MNRYLMVPKWKRLLGATSVLLLAGAGCPAMPEQEAAPPVEAPSETEDDDRKKADVGDPAESEADAVADALLEEAEEDTELEEEEGNDADVVTDDAAELDAYGQAYDESRL